LDKMREQEMETGDWMRMDKVKCAQDMKGGDLLAVSLSRFIVQDGGIIKLRKEIWRWLA
jgi:hypothetical protein